MNAVPKITLESLATMMQRQFAEIIAVMATKDDIARLEARMDKFETRMDRMENLILTDHRNRLERVEDRIRVLETKRGA